MKRCIYGFGVWLVLLLGWAGLNEMASATVPAIPQGVCPEVQNTLYFTIVYGTVTRNGAAAPVGTVVEARSPRGDVVGCTVVTQAGSYGALYVYGEDTSVTPAVPGMRDGESVAFYVDGIAASAEPVLAWSNDHQFHTVTLTDGGGVITPTLTPTAITPGVCPEVINTLKFTVVYGGVTIGGAPAPAGSVVEARNSSGDVVGCYVVAQAGSYGAFYAYGADDAASPSLPGMQPGELVTFYVSGRQATAAPLLAWENDRNYHEVTLNASADEPTPTSTPTPTVTPEPGPPRIFLPLVMRQ